MARVQLRKESGSLIHFSHPFWWGGLLVFFATLFIYASKLPMPMAVAIALKAASLISLVTGFAVWFYRFEVKFRPNNRTYQVKHGIWPLINYKEGPYDELIGVVLSKRGISIFKVSRQTETSQMGSRFCIHFNGSTLLVLLDSGWRGGKISDWTVCSSLPNQSFRPIRSGEYYWNQLESINSQFRRSNGNSRLSQFLIWWAPRKPFNRTWKKRLSSRIATQKLQNAYSFSWHSFSRSSVNNPCLLLLLCYFSTTWFNVVQSFFVSYGPHFRNHCDHCWRNWVLWKGTIDVLQGTGSNWSRISFDSHVG